MHGANDDDAWIAIEHKVCDQLLVYHFRFLILLKVLLFQFDSPKTILTLSDVTETLELGNNEEEALNEVSRI